MREKPFNIERCLRTTLVEGLSIAQLLTIAPALRKILADALKSLPKDQRLFLLQSHPSLGICNEDSDVSLFLTQAHIAKDSTHHFPVTVHGNQVYPYLDGGACVNMCSLGFLAKAGITNYDPVSGMGVQTISGRAKVIGEVQDVPLCIADTVTVLVSCVILDVPFDLLLGRGFLEMVQAVTVWNGSIYRMTIQGYQVLVNANGKTIPMVTRLKKEPSPKARLQTSPLLAPTLSDTNESTPDLSEESETEDESSTESDNIGSAWNKLEDDTPEEEDTSAGTTDSSDYNIMFLQALEQSMTAPISEEELLDEAQRGEILGLYLLQAQPPAIPHEWTEYQDLAQD